MPRRSSGVGVVADVDGGVVIRASIGGFSAGEGESVGAARQGIVAGAAGGAGVAVVAIGDRQAILPRWFQRGAAAAVVDGVAVERDIQIYGCRRAGRPRSPDHQPPTSSRPTNRLKPPVSAPIRPQCPTPPPARPPADIGTFPIRSSPASTDSCRLARIQCDAPGCAAHEYCPMDVIGRAYASLACARYRPPRDAGSVPIRRAATSDEKRLDQTCPVAQRSSRIPKTQLTSACARSSIHVAGAWLVNPPMSQ